MRIVARNGLALTYVSTPDGEGYEDIHNYAVIGVLDAGRFAVVLDRRWEGRNVILVSLNDGSVYPIDGTPIASPDRERIAIHSRDLEANYDANFLAVYRLDGTSLVKEVVLDGGSDYSGMWAPDQVEWISANRIAFNRVRHSTDSLAYIYEPWLLELEKSVWKSRPAAEH